MMERHVGLVYQVLVLLCINLPLMNADRGQIHIRGKSIYIQTILYGTTWAFLYLFILGSHYHDPSDAVAFESECRCNRNDEMSISVSKLIKK